MHVLKRKPKVVPLLVHFVAATILKDQHSHCCNGIRVASQFDRCQALFALAQLFEVLVALSLESLAEKAGCQEIVGSKLPLQAKPDSILQGYKVARYCLKENCGVFVNIIPQRDY